jgi:O-antigen/teichoic acid export membrane protein
MTDEVDARAYLLAPLLPPTVHVVLAPVWSVLSGRPELALSVMAWQFVAWFALQAVCLATMTPLLWLLRRSFVGRRLSKRATWTLAGLSSGLASFALLGPIPALHSPAISWFAAFAAAALVFLGFHRSRGHPYGRAAPDGT